MKNIKDSSVWYEEVAVELQALHGRLRRLQMYETLECDGDYIRGVRFHTSEIVY